MTVNANASGVWNDGGAPANANADEILSHVFVVATESARLVRRWTLNNLSSLIKCILCGDCYGKVDHVGCQCVCPATSPWSGGGQNVSPQIELNSSRERSPRLEGRSS